MKLIIAIWLFFFFFFFSKEGSYPSPGLLDASYRARQEELVNRLWMPLSPKQESLLRRHEPDMVSCCDVEWWQLMACLHSTVDRFITLFSSNINNTSMLLPHQPIAALAEQPPDNKASLYMHTWFLQRCLSLATDGVAQAFISSFICHPFCGLAGMTGLSGRFRAMFS